MAQTHDLMRVLNQYIPGIHLPHMQNNTMLYKTMLCLNYNQLKNKILPKSMETTMLVAQKNNKKLVSTPARPLDSISAQPNATTQLPVKTVWREKSHYWMRTTSASHETIHLGPGNAHRNI